MKAIVAERGQVTIPKALRQQLGIHPGTILDFDIENGHLIATKTTNQDPIDQVYGCLGHHLDTDALIDEMRGKA